MLLNGVNDVKRLVESGYALQTLYKLMSQGDISSGNVAKLETVVNQLEIHENEVRRYRQTLSLRPRQYFLES